MANSLASLFRSPIDDFHVDSLIGATTTGCGPGPSAGKSSSAPPPAKAAPPHVHECDISFVDVAISRSGGTTRQLTIPAASNQKGGQTRIDVLANLRKDLPGSKAKDTTQLSLTVVAFASCSCSKHPLLTVTPASSG